MLFLSRLFRAHPGLLWLGILLVLGSTSSPASDFPSIASDGVEAGADDCLTGSRELLYEHFVSLGDPEPVARWKAQHLTADEVDLLVRHTYLLRKGSASSSGRPRLAILEFEVVGHGRGIAATDGRAVADRLTSEFAASSGYQLIDRTNLKRILEEQNLQVTDIINPSTRARRNNVSGVEYIIVGSVNSLGDTVGISARLINVETGRVEGTGEIQGPNINSLVGNIRSLAHQLQGKQTYEKVTWSNPPPTPRPATSSPSSSGSSSAPSSSGDDAGAVAAVIIIIITIVLIAAAAAGGGGGGGA